MFRKEDNPPAIVKEADQSINDLTGKIKDSWVRYQARGRELAGEGKSIGKYLSQIKARMPGKFRDWVRTNLPFTYDHARRLIRLFEAERDRENSSGAAPDEFSLSDRLAKNLNILFADEVAANGDLPFKPPETPKAAENERETGDETQYDQQAAEILAKLCERCARIGQPSCELCRGKAARIRAGEKVPDARRTKPNDERDRKAEQKKIEAKNGQLLFNWIEWNDFYEGVVKGIDRLAVVADIPNVNPKLEALRLKAGEFLDAFRLAAEEVLKQKAPTS